MGSNPSSSFSMVRDSCVRFATHSLTSSEGVFQQVFQQVYQRMYQSVPKDVPKCSKTDAKMPVLACAVQGKAFGRISADVRGIRYPIRRKAVALTLAQVAEIWNRLGNGETAGEVIAGGFPRTSVYCIVKQIAAGEANSPDPSELAMPCPRLPSGSGRG